MNRCKSRIIRIIMGIAIAALLSSCTATDNTTGLQGTPGATGATGQQGTPGATGATGQQGTPGATGATGQQGTPGATGATGQQGTPGATGATGQQGTPGATGATGQQGTPGATGATGQQGTPGATGQQGTPGATGATGQQGTPGATGDSVLGNLGCSANQVIAWNGSGWVCKTNTTTALLSTNNYVSSRTTIGTRFEIRTANIDPNTACATSYVPGYPPIKVTDICNVKLIDVSNHSDCVVAFSGNNSTQFGRFTTSVDYITISNPNAGEGSGWYNVSIFCG